MQEKLNSRNIQNEAAQLQILAKQSPEFLSRVLRIREILKKIGENHEPPNYVRTSATRISSGETD